MGLIDQITSWLPIPANLFVCIVLPVITLIIVIFLMKYFGIKIIPEKYKFVKPKNTGFFDSILETEIPKESQRFRREPDKVEDFAENLEIEKKQNFYNK